MIGTRVSTSVRLDSQFSTVNRQGAGHSGRIRFTSGAFRLLVFTALLFGCPSGVPELIHTSGFHPALTFPGQ
ncbi:hypothetical protein [Arthrobacter sp. zg-Y769]|uniref:hypothetical protein n=1 Tax=Arthrobacter sp. zg-Y769 TaxID=2894191 RepID=UPI001E3A8980|nr:hypothetical protein [Arthrobacter sp. zg-Y769]MCC9206069.1 hypothetical protein [Arthrobacter sp. zg-Y769]